jgi:hypothetical protein
VFVEYAGSVVPVYDVIADPPLLVDSVYPTTAYPSKKGSETTLVGAFGRLAALAAPVDPNSIPNTPDIMTIPIL